LDGRVRAQEKAMESQSRNHTARPLPEIIVSNSDYARLTGLANAALERLPDIADELLAELDRATVVADESLPDNIVRMGSIVEFRTGGERKRVTLVFPTEADIAAGRVSILTPLGTALIGLAKGGSIMWTGRDGRSHELTVLAVEQPA
jgi:regulator of nucleoside diphosphate kinase